MTSEPDTSSLVENRNMSHGDGEWSKKGLLLLNRWTNLSGTVTAWDLTLTHYCVVPLRHTSTLV